MYLSYAVWIKFDIVDIVVDVAGVIGMISFYRVWIGLVAIAKKAC